MNYVELLIPPNHKPWRKPWVPAVVVVSLYVLQGQEVGFAKGASQLLACL